MTDETTEIPKKYNPETEEQKVIDFWQNNNINTFEYIEGKEIYSIDTPPPTVSGNMHIGHAFSYSQEDFIARYKKLAGFNVFYPFGTDDNGLPTERLVEKKKKVKSTMMDRTEFRELCYNTIVELKEDFIWDWKRIGMSCDFTKSYSTIDKDSQRLSQKTFIELYKKELVYEQEAPMSWCPTCQTAIAQAEFESKDQDSFFNDIIFKSSEGDDLLIATTRPEFIPACVALFAHPEDKRYSHLKGKTAKVPLFDYEVPIIFDEAVEKDKGTGLMMVCTFGDKEDIDKWKRHNL
ncbi:MAG: class I tRNA ligase family protein, partial [bacterium]